MPSNRFDFLEFEEQPQPAPDIIAAAPPPQEMLAGSPAPVMPRSPGSATHNPLPTRGVSKKTPPRLSEVRVEDPRGYQAILGGTDSASASNSWRRMGAVKTLKAAEIIGARGARAGQFNFPAGLAVDSAGILFVADSFNHRVQRITPDGGVSIIGTRGTANAQFMNPMDIAVDAARSFYVIEQGTSRVQKFTVDGTLTLVFGKPGFRPGEMNNPMGIAVSPVTGEIVIADTGNNRVSRYDTLGKFLGFLGDMAGDGSRLSAPQAVCCDFRGNIYVADTRGDRIARFDPGGRSLGDFHGHPGYESPVASANFEIDQPHALACTDAGDLIIADGADSFGRVTVIDADSGSLTTSMTRASRQLGPFAKPCGVAIAPSASADRRGDVYIADTLNHRILRFTWH